MSGTRMSLHPIHLGLGASAVIEPEFSGSMDWYVGYIERHQADGIEGRLVSLSTFTGPWTAWEMHPHGDEVVLCVSGSITLHQEQPDGSRHTVDLQPGEYAINARGTWHTADVSSAATVVFVTAGVGTEHRAR